MLDKNCIVVPAYDPGLSFAYLAGLMIAIQQKEREEERKFNALPAVEQEQIRQEQAKREQEREAAREQRRIEFSVHQGKCPDYGSKLVRGKKDKRNGYKRPWSCNCGKVFWL